MSDIPASVRVRLAALKQYEVLDTGPEEAFDRITRLVAKVVRVPVSLISLVDAKRQFFKSALGLSEPWASQRETPLSHSLCQHVVTSKAPLVISDTLRHPLSRESLAVSDLRVGAYAGVPLRTKGGIVLGALCAINPAPREWAAEDVEVLQEFAEVVIDELDLRIATRRLLKLEASRRERNKLESVGRLCSGIAHDFNNIVTMILADVDLARETTPTSPELLEHLQNIEDASLRAAQLTGQLLVFGRSHPIQKKPLSLNAFLRDTVALLRRTVRPQVEISVREGIDLPPVRADRDLLVQVLVNFIANANDAMPNGGAIVISSSYYEPPALHEFSSRDTNASYLCVTVEDNGIGIAADDLPRVFEPFFSTKEVGQGTGLGLSSAYGIAQQHDGWLEIESDPGGGTVVRLVLPALSEERVDRV